MADPIRWQDVIKLSIQTVGSEEAKLDQAEKDMQDIVPVLERLEQTEAGQRLLQQLQHQLNNQGQSKLVITFNRDVAGNETFLTGKECLTINGVNINLKDMANLQYKGTDGQFHDYEINQWVIHELVGHAIMVNKNEQDAVTYTNTILGVSGMNIHITENGQEMPFPLRGDYYEGRVKPGVELPPGTIVNQEKQLQEIKKDDEKQSPIRPCGEKELYKMAALKEGDLLKRFAADYYQTPSTTQPISKPGRELN